VFHPQSQDLFLAKPSVIPPFGIRYRQAIEELNIDLGQIAKFEFPRTPPWTYESVFVDWRMSYNCKTDTSPTVFRAEYLRIKSEYEHHVYIYTDGSKSGEKVAAAAVTEQLEFKCRLADNASIFTAELKGIELALSEIETTQGEDLVIFSDSIPLYRHWKEMIG
jgi:hypothetical protein